MTSATGVPVSACFSANAICSSVYLTQLLAHRLQRAGNLSPSADEKTGRTSLCEPVPRRPQMEKALSGRSSDRCGYADGSALDWRRGRAARFLLPLSNRRSDAVQPRRPTIGRHAPWPARARSVLRIAAVAGLPRRHDPARSQVLTRPVRRRSSSRAIRPPPPFSAPAPAKRGRSAPPSHPRRPTAGAPGTGTALRSPWVP